MWIDFRLYIMRMLVLLLQLFPDGLQCTLMILAPLPYMLKPILFPNPNFENTTIIAREINKLRREILEVLHRKIKLIELVLQKATMFWNAFSLFFYLNIPYFLIIFYFRWERSISSAF